MEMKEFKSISKLSLDYQLKSPLSERRQAVLHSKCFHVLLNTQCVGRRVYSRPSTPPSRWVKLYL